MSDLMNRESGRSVNPQHNDEPEKGIVVDMLRRGLKIVPAWLLISLLIWGVDGALSAAYGVALIFANFLTAALFLTWAARISPSALMFAALFGFLVRLGALTVAVIAVSKISFFAPVPLGLSLIHI